MNIYRTERDSRKQARTGRARATAAKREPLLLPDGSGRYVPVSEHSLDSLLKHLGQNRIIVRSHAKGQRYMTESAVKFSLQCIAAIENELKRVKMG